MFRPVSLTGKLFREYLLMFSHPAKIRIQNVIGKLFFAKGLRLKNQDAVLFTLDANDWITRIMLIEEDYENESTLLAKKILSNGGLFIDVGANFGLFTCITAHGNDKVKVLAVEPNHRVIKFLINNIKQNGLKERVQVINAAVLEEFQLVTMEQPISNNLGTTVTRTATDGFLSVLGCSLEFICREKNAFCIDLLKIDIEGNEFDILKNFPFEVYKIKNIILEYNRLSTTGFYTLHSFFADKGFKSCTVTGEKLLSDKQDIPENNIWFVNQQY